MTTFIRVKRWSFISIKLQAPRPVANRLNGHTKLKCFSGCPSKNIDDNNNNQNLLENFLQQYFMLICIDSISNDRCWGIALPCSHIIWYSCMGRNNCALIGQPNFHWSEFNHRRLSKCTRKLTNPRQIPCLPTLNPELINSIRQFYFCLFIIVAVNNAIILLISWQLKIFWGRLLNGTLHPESWIAQVAQERKI